MKPGVRAMSSADLEPAVSALILHAVLQQPLHCSYHLIGHHCQV